MTPWHAPTTPFVGRADDASRLADAVAGQQPLVTVTGPGGIGKTRLVQEVLGDTGAMFVDLSTADSLASVVSAVGAPLLGMDSPMDSSMGAPDVAAVGRALAHVRPKVVVLDNAEQAFDALPRTLGTWLGGSQGTTWVATSRRALALPGESLLPLGPLDAAAASDLFMAATPPPQRASLDPHAVTSLVSLLDGLPLALEIAAARLSVLSIEELSQRLGEQLSVLSDPVGRRPERHRTLEATLAWSWDLLDPWLRDALAQLSGFVGAFDLQAAEAVVSLDDGHSVMNALQALVGRSLVQVSAPPAPRRFRMLSTTRAFAHERLPDHTRRALERRIAEWVIGELQPLHDASREGNPEADRRLQAPHGGDGEAALAASIERGDRQLALKLANLVFPAMTARSENQRILTLLEQALALPAAPADDPLDEGRAIRCLALACVGLGQRAEARRWAARLHTYPSDDLVAWGHAILGQASTGPDVLQHWNAAAASSIPTVKAWGRIGQAHAARAEGDMDTAIELVTQAVLFARQRSNTRSLVIVLWEASDMLACAGRLDDAVDSLREALQLCRATQHHQGHCVAALMLAETELRRRQPTTALAYLDEIADLCRRIGNVQAEVSERALRAIAAGMLERPDASELAIEAEHAASDMEWPENRVCVACWTALVRAHADAAGAKGLVDLASEVADAHPGLVVSGGIPATALVETTREIVPHLTPSDRASLEQSRAALSRIGADQRTGRDLGVARAYAAWAAARMPESEHALIVAADGRWFEAPGAERVDLSTRSAQRAVLAALLSGRHGRPLTRTDLVEAGWPGERILENAAANRVRVTLSHLRKAGLDVIERTQGGWRLDPTAPLWVVPATVAG